MNKIISALFAACLFALFACSNEVVDLPDNKCDSYLGMGYDVINSSYINIGDVKRANPILDQEKLCQDNLIVTSPFAGTQKYESFTGSSIKEFYQERNSGFNIGLNVDLSALFSGNYKAEFGISNSNTTNLNEVKQIFYSRMLSYRYTQDDYIKEATPQSLSNYLSESFVNNLKNKTVEEILNLYGTHVFIRYYKGGSLEANYKYTGSSLTETNRVKKAVEASFAGATGGTNSSNTSDKNELESKMSFRYYTYGGKPLSATDIEQLKKEYGDWTESIANNADICGIGNFNQSFIPIWELARAAGETAKATELEKEFKERAIRQGKAFLVKNIKIRTEEYHMSDGEFWFDEAAKDSPAEVEIYALGGGGGGQGGNRISSSCGLLGLSTCYENGTGGGGGSGALAYLKLSVDEPAHFKIAIGQGGTGGSSYSGTEELPGYRGGNGGETRVEVGFGNENIAVWAEGGKGGGASGTNGGTGGRDARNINPSSKTFYSEDKFIKGNDGWNGTLNGDWKSEGGSGPKISKGDAGNSEDFGGSPGATRTSSAQAAGGGAGGYEYGSGSSGGRGFVLIKIFYYTNTDE